MGRLFAIDLLVNSGQASGALNEVLGLVRAVGDGFQEASRLSKQTADEFIRQRDALREIAMLQGGQANTSLTLDAAAFSRKTGLSIAEGNRFRTEFLNTGAQFLDKNISAKEGEQLQQQAAALAAAKGLDPGIMGDAVGNLLGFRDYRQFGDQASETVLGDVYKVMQGLGRGRGSNAVLMRNATSLMAQALNEDELKGVFQRPEDVVALISTMAESKPGQAEVFGRAALKALRGFDRKQGDLLGRAGVTADTGFRDAAERVGKTITDEAHAEKIPVQDVIARYFSDERERVAMATLINKGIGPGGAIADRLSFMEQFGAEGALEDIARFQSDAEGAGPDRIAKAAMEEARLRRGADRAKFETLRTQAEARLLERGEIDTSLTNAADFVLDKASPDVQLGLASGQRERRIRREMAAMLNERGRRAGLGLGLTGPGMIYAGETDEGGVDRLNRAMGQIEAAGGNPLSDEMVGVLKEIRDRLPAQQRPLAPPRPAAGAGR